MSYGIEVRDAAGQLLLDTSGRAAYLHGEYVVSGVPMPYNGTYTINVPGISNDGTWFVYLMNQVDFKMEIIANGIKFTNTIQSTGLTLDVTAVVIRG